MKVEDFFDNLAVFFKDEEDLSVEGLMSIYRDDEGLVTEVRIFNPEYEEFLVISRERRFEIINVSEFKESVIEQKNDKKIKEEKSPAKKPRKEKR